MTNGRAEYFVWMEKRTPGGVSYMQRMTMAGTEDIEKAKKTADELADRYGLETVVKKVVEKTVYRREATR